MLLRQDKSKFFSSKFSSRKLFIFVIALLFVSYSLVIFIFGASTYRYEMANGKPIITEIKSTFEKLTSLKNYSQALNYRHRINKKIDIKHKDFQRLAYDRQVGLDKSRLFENVFVPAEISHNGQVYKIRTRLKGDFQDHFQSPSKWSLRVEIKDKDKSLMGMTRFSLQSPKTRNYLHEWLYHKLLKREDIIALKYDFVKVEINGKDLGIYAIEEHFDKVLIESNNRREGPILKLNEDILWTEHSRARGRGHGGDFPSTIIELINPGAFASDHSSSNIETFNTKNTLNNQN